MMKKSKVTKKCVIEGKLQFENCKNCLQLIQFENKINRVENYKFNLDWLKKIIKNANKEIN